jgi:hypothetical protein
MPPAFATIATKINQSVLDVPHSNFSKHQHIQIYPLNSPTTLNQTWTIVEAVGDLPQGYANIFAGHEPSNHLCLDIPDSNTTPRTLIQLYPVNGPGGSKNQQWKLIPAGDNYVYIASALDHNLVLDVRGGSGDPHTLIQIFNQGNQQPNQLWILNLAT